MSKKVRHILVSSAISLLILIIQVWRSWPDSDAHFVFCDVGQGDAILVTSSFTQLLIDGGRSDEKIMACLEDHLPFWDRTIELVVATHADADHIGGLDAVIENYEVKKIISTDFKKETKTFADFKKAVEQELRVGSVLKKPILGQQMRFTQEGPPLLLSILSPRVEQLQVAVENSPKTEAGLSDLGHVLGVAVDEEFDYNQLSIVLLLEVGEVRLILTGDLEQEIELALIDSELLSDVDILKVGHHGAKTSTSPEFIEVVRPETSIVSVGESNSYGHPSLETINNLTQFDSKILRTDELGSIELVSDGKKYWLLSKN